MRIITGLRVSAAAAGAVGALAILPVGANAAFDPAFGAQCQGATSIAGRGASFQRQAHLAWGAQLFAPDPAPAETNGFGYTSLANGGCASFGVGRTNGVVFEPLGSGDGRDAMGATGGVRNTAVHFGAADEPPTTAQLKAANEGPTASTADDASLLTVPVAQSSVAVAVKLPDGCTVAYADHKISRAALEGVFAGKTAYDTWGEVFTSLAGTSCGSTVVQRVVRFDSSGTTFGFKNYLRDIDASLNAGTPQDFKTSLKNQEWPTNGTAPKEITANNVKGAGALLDTLSALPGGGIGYADLATSRNRGYDQNVDTSGSSTTNPNFGKPDNADPTFWLNVERKDGAYQSPALADTRGTANTGSNCRNATYGDGTSTELPAVTESWAGVNANRSTADYSLCVLTYELVWADMAKANFNRASTAPAYTQAHARAVKDYLGYILNTNGGQAALAPNGYQGLPAATETDGTAVAGSVLAVAQAAQKSLTWNQSTVVTPPGGGDTGGGDTGGGNTGGGNTGGGNTTPPVKTNPPAPVPAPAPQPTPAPAQVGVTVSKAAGAKGRRITLTLSPSAAGKVSVSATTGSGSKKVAVGKASATVTKSGTLKVTLKPGAKAKGALKAGRTVKVTFKVTFTATSGAKTTVTKTIKVKIKR
jgi:hypothetical protein